MSKGKFALGALFGAIAGLAAGVLTAPKSGKETRAELKVKAEELKSDVSKKAEYVASEATDIAENVKEKAQGAANEVKVEVVDLKDRTDKAVEGAKRGFFEKK